jgi:hypothetical protein
MEKEYSRGLQTPDEKEMRKMIKKLVQRGSKRGVG